jgi:hypothetical protein
MSRGLLAFGHHDLLAHQPVELLVVVGAGIVERRLDLEIARHLVERFGQHLLARAPLHDPADRHRIDQVAKAADAELAACSRPCAPRSPR